MYFPYRDTLKAQNIDLELLYMYCFRDLQNNASE